MNERELTKLWYLADAIVVTPEASWSRIFKLVEAHSSKGWFQRPSRELTVAVTRMQYALAACGSAREAAGLLLHQPEEAAKDAGRALSWALENRSKARV